MYTKDDAVVQAAWYADAPAAGSEDAGKVNGINYFWKPFYYKHVETFVGTDGAEELVPLKHFLHRFTRCAAPAAPRTTTCTGGARLTTTASLTPPPQPRHHRSIFWEIEDMIPFANHPVYRVLWGWLGAPEVSLLKLFQGPVIRKASVYAHVVQESIAPLRRLSECIELFDGVFGVYPLLVFPVRVFDRQGRSGPSRPGLSRQGTMGIMSAIPRLNPHPVICCCTAEITQVTLRSPPRDECDPNSRFLPSEVNTLDLIVVQLSAAVHPPGIDRCPPCRGGDVLGPALRVQLLPKRNRSSDVDGDDGTSPVYVDLTVGHPLLSQRGMSQVPEEAAVRMTALHRKRLPHVEKECRLLSRGHFHGSKGDLPWGRGSQVTMVTHTYAGG